MKISHGIEYGLVRLLALIFGSLSFDAARNLGRRLGRAAGNLWKSRHDVVIKNLEIAFGEKYSGPEREELARKVFENLGATMAEVCHFPKMSKADILDRVTSERSEVFDEALRGGRGAILVGSHFGNWELLAAYVNALGYPVDFLVRGQHNKMVDNYLSYLRRSAGVGLIHSESKMGMKAVIRALKANRQVAIASDQHAGSGGILVEFFGRLVSVPRAPATLAVRMNCPLISGYILRRGKGRYHCKFTKAVYPDPGADKNAEILRLTKIYTKRFEQVIREYPEYWLWTHRRFKPIGAAEQSEGTFVE